VVIRLEPRAGLRAFVHEGRTPIAGAMVAVTALENERVTVSGVTGEDGIGWWRGRQGRLPVVVQSSEFASQAPIEVRVWSRAGWRRSTSRWIAAVR